MTADAYSARVRACFRNPAHAGEVSGGNGARFEARASEGGAGARLLLTALTDGDTLSELRYRVFGCPHLIAAAEAACERFEGQPVETLADFSVEDMQNRLDVPIEKKGRLLLLEDALKSLQAAIRRGENEGN